MFDLFFGKTYLTKFEDTDIFGPVSKTLTVYVYMLRDKDTR